MNKLVSRNPVQRFKQGQKIVKAENGWLTSLKALGYATGLYTPETVNGITKVPQLGGGYEYFEGGKRGRWVTDESRIRKAFGSRNRDAQEEFATKYLTDVTDTTDDNGNLIKKHAPIEDANKNRSAKLKKSGGQSFQQAFNAARNAGLKEFTWNGGRFNTMTAAEKNAGATTFQNGRWVAPVDINLPNFEEVTHQNSQNVPIANHKDPNFLRDAIDGGNTTPQSTVIQNDFAASKQAGYPTASRGQQLLNAVTLRPEYRNIGQFNWRDALKYTFSAKQGGQLVSRNPITRFKQNCGGRQNFR